MAKKRASSTSAPAPTPRGDSGPFAPVLLDPRSQPEFEPEHFPLCDGGSAPAPGTTDPIACRKIEFLAVYYRLNRLLARLQASRTGAVAASPDIVRRDILRAILDRDALEDRYEPEGFLGEPVMDGIFYRALEFTHAHSRQFYRPLASSHFSCSIPIPPAGVRADGWVRRHLRSNGAPVPGGPPGAVAPPPPPTASEIDRSQARSSTAQASAARAVARVRRRGPAALEGRPQR